MFKDAFAIASRWTFPVVVSTREVSGKCSAGIGAYVLINDEGWIVTAGHIIKQITDAMQSVARYKKSRSI